MNCVFHCKAAAITSNNYIGYPEPKPSEEARSADYADSMNVMMGGFLNLNTSVHYYYN